MKGFDQVNIIRQDLRLFYPIQISKYETFIIILCFLTAFLAGSACAQFTQPQMVVEWQRAKTYTKTYLDAMPADGYSFKPTPEIRSFAQQMLHLANDNYGFASYASGKQTPAADTALEQTVQPTKDATTKAVMESYDFMISTLQGYDA